MLAENAADAGQAWAGPPAVQRRHVGVGGGRRVSAICWGQEPAQAVLLHGGGQNAHTWDTVALALGRPVVAIDLPGHGRSDWRPGHDYTAANMAEDVAAAMAELAPAARLVVGMSLGGLTTLALASARPSLVPRVLLVDVTPGVDAARAKAIADFVSGPTRFASFDEILDHTVRHNPGRDLRSLRRGVLHNAAQHPDGTWSWRWDPERAPGAADTDFGSLWEVLDGFTGPLLLVRGARSPVVDDGDVAELRRRKPDARVVVVDGAGHSVQGDRPVVLAGIIAAELAAGG